MIPLILYFLQYLVVATESLTTIIGAILIQMILNLYYGTSKRLILSVAGLLLTLALLVLLWVVFWDSDLESLLVFCFRFGVVAYATLLLMRLVTIGDVSIAMEKLRFPVSFNFTLGVALSSLPLFSEELHRLRLTMHSYGFQYMKEGVSPIKLLFHRFELLMLGLMLRVMERVEAFYATLALRGFGKDLYSINLMKPIDRGWLFILQGVVPTLIMVEKIGVLSLP